METWHDKEEDILNVQIKEGYWKSIELPNGIIIDIAKDGSISGTETFQFDGLTGCTRQLNRMPLTTCTGCTRQLYPIHASCHVLLGSSCHVLLVMQAV